MQAVKEFFNNYGSLSLAKDPQALAALYADNFIAAGPKGSMVFANDEKFIEWLVQVQQFNEKTGMEKLNVVRVTDTPIGEAYTSATVTWSAFFGKKINQAVEFDITYILRNEKNSHRVVMYVSHEDQEEVMKKKGLI